MAIKDDDAMEIMEALTVGLHPGSTDVPAVAAPCLEGKNR